MVNLLHAIVQTRFTTILLLVLLSHKQVADVLKYYERHCTLPSKRNIIFSWKKYKTTAIDHKGKKPEVVLSVNLVVPGHA